MWLIFVATHWLALIGSAFSRPEVASGQDVSCPNPDEVLIVQNHDNLLPNIRFTCASLTSCERKLTCIESDCFVPGSFFNQVNLADLTDFSPKCCQIDMITSNAEEICYTYRLTKPDNVTELLEQDEMIDDKDGGFYYETPGYKPSDIEDLSMGAHVADFVQCPPKDAEVLKDIIFVDDGSVDVVVCRLLCLDENIGDYESRRRDLLDRIAGPFVGNYQNGTGDKGAPPILHSPEYSEPTKKPKNPDKSNSKESTVESVTIEDGATDTTGADASDAKSNEVTSGQTLEQTTNQVHVDTPAPVVNPIPEGTPVPLGNPAPVVTPAPVPTPEPVVNPKPVVTPVPVANPATLGNPALLITPAPVVNPVPLANPTVPSPPPPVPQETRGEKQHAPGVPPQKRCFSGYTQVQTKHGHIIMRDLKINDEVLVALDDDSNGPQAFAFQPVYWFLHKNPEEMAEFVQITTPSGEHIRITPKHLIPVTNCEDQRTTLKFADEVSTSDCLVSVGVGAREFDLPVSSVTRVMERGFYSPLTRSGNLIVGSGVRVSCYSQFKNEAIQKVMFRLLHRTSSLLTSVRQMVFGSVDHEVVELSPIWDLLDFVSTLI